MREHASETFCIPWTTWLREMQISETTGWRWKNKGWITPFYIAGRQYVTLEEIARFKARALAGEFTSASRPSATRF